MSWAEVSKVNGDFLNAPLDIKLHLAEYKMYGEDSYVFQQKELLHSLYECTYLSMNDRRINGEALEHLVKNNRHVGEVLITVFDIGGKDVIRSLRTMAAVANSTTAMQAVLNSTTAMQAVLNSSTAMQAVANSTTAMQAVLNSSTAMQAVLNSSTAMTAVANSSAAMTAILNSSTAIMSIVKSAMCLKTICKSEIASKIIKNEIQNKEVRNAMLNTLTNSPEHFFKTETEWYYYGDTANKINKVIDDDNTIIIPTIMQSYYADGQAGALFYGADKNVLKQINSMTKEQRYPIEDVVSMRSMYFCAYGYVRTFATVFTAK